MMRANIASQRKPAIHIIHDVLLMEGPAFGEAVVHSGVCAAHFFAAFISEL